MPFRTCQQLVNTLLSTSATMPPTQASVHLSLAHTKYEQNEASADLLHQTMDDAIETGLLRLV